MRCKTCGSEVDKACTNCGTTVERRKQQRSYSLRNVLLDGEKARRVVGGVTTLTT